MEAEKMIDYEIKCGWIKFWQGEADYAPFHDFINALNETSKQKIVSEDLPTHTFTVPELFKPEFMRIKHEHFPKPKNQMELL